MTEAEFEDHMAELMEETSALVLARSMDVPPWRYDEFLAKISDFRDWVVLFTEQFPGDGGVDAD